MEQAIIDRINELARKSRVEELSDDEKWEQKILRQEYIAAFRNNVEGMLEQTYIMDEEGNKIKLQKKESHSDSCGCGCEERHRHKH